MNFDQISIKVL